MKQYTNIIFFFSLALFIFTGCTANNQLESKNPIAEDGYSFSKRLTKAEYDYIQAVIPSTKILNAEKTPINGLYKVYTGQNSIYVYPYKKLLIFGEIWTNTGVRLADNKQAETMTSATGQNKAIREPKNALGSLYYEKLIKNALSSNTKQGDYKFIVFKSPTCPNCFVLDKYFKMKDIKVHNLYSPNKLSAYVLKHEYKIQNPQQVLNKHLELSKPINPSAVPYIIILDKDNKPVETIKGANLPALNKYLPTGVNGINEQQFRKLYSSTMGEARQHITNLMSQNK